MFKYHKGWEVTKVYETAHDRAYNIKPFHYWKDSTKRTINQHWQWADFGDENTSAEVRRDWNRYRVIELW